jgi:hypothetical protein
MNYFGGCGGKVAKHPHRYIVVIPENWNILQKKPSISHLDGGENKYFALYWSLLARRLSQVLLGYAHYCE